MTYQRPSMRAETSIKVWMTGLNPNYNTTLPNSALNFRKSRRNDTVYFAWRRHLGLPFPLELTTLRRNSLIYSQLCAFEVELELEQVHTSICIYAPIYLHQFTSLGSDHVHLKKSPSDTRCNNNVIMTSKRRRDVILTS